MSEGLSVTMTVGKITKNMVRYESEDSNVPTLYVSKAVLPSPIPNSITVTVKPN